jgi:hypothetical protein
VHAHVQSLVSVVKMATVLECNIEEQHSVVRFLRVKGLMQRICIKKCFVFTAGSVCRVKLFTSGGKYFADEKVETEMRKWLRQQSKDFCVAGFNTLVKRWESESMLMEDLSRNKCFFQVRISHILRFKSICDLLTDCFLYIHSYL